MPRNALSSPDIRVGILSTGTEIVQGLYPDTNSTWLSARLTASGLRVHRHVAAPDHADDVADALRYLARECQVVIMTGGLGPTEDDLTRQAVCQVFNTKLREDERAWAMIEARFAHRGIVPPQSNRVQCLIPSGARVLYNEWGTAPGFVMEPRSAKLPWFAALPGPPREMQPMFEKYIEKELARRFGGGAIANIRTLHTFGHSESQLNDLLRDLFQQVRQDPQLGLALLASDAKVDVRLVARGNTAGNVRKRMQDLTRKVRRRLPQGAIYGVDQETLEQVVSRMLRRKGLRLAVAESCTGGLVAKRITDLAGSSDLFLEGFVTYSNIAKHERLGVRLASLKRFGAVSAAVAEEMARGAIRKSGADVAVSITGIAGPSGGSVEKPVGTVWYGLSWRRENGEIESTTTRTVFVTGRDMVRAFASHRALDLVRRHVSGLPLDFSAPPSKGRAE